MVPDCFATSHWSVWGAVQPSVISIELSWSNRYLKKDEIKALIHVCTCKVRS